MQTCWTVGGVKINELFEDEEETESEPADPSGDKLWCFLSTRFVGVCGDWAWLADDVKLFVVVTVAWCGV